MPTCLKLIGNIDLYVEEPAEQILSILAMANRSEFMGLTVVGMGVTHVRRDAVLTVANDPV